MLYRSVHIQRAGAAGYIQRGHLHTYAVTGREGASERKKPLLFAVTGHMEAKAISAAASEWRKQIIAHTVAEMTTA
jgi:hypothetical protein